MHLTLKKYLDDKHIAMLNGQESVETFSGLYLWPQEPLWFQVALTSFPFAVEGDLMENITRVEDERESNCWSLFILEQKTSFFVAEFLWSQSFELTYFMSPGNFESIYHDSPCLMDLETLEIWENLVL